MENSPLRILLVEDDPADARLVRELLADVAAGAAVPTHAKRLAHAVSRLEVEQVDVILLDLSLPDGQGLRSLSLLQTVAPHVPIVIMSACADEALAVQGVQAGAQDYLVKGRVSGDALHRALRYAVERRRADERLTYLAFHDVLTGLPNRALFSDRLQQALARAHRHTQGLAVLLLDLDRFKEVNDTLGHDYGDLLLRQASTRVQGVMRNSDTVARLGGDEFALLLPETDEAGAVAVARKVLAALAEPLLLEAHTFTMAGSVGIALLPAHGQDATTLLRHADVAMYVAKRRGGGDAVYAPEQDAHSARRLTLEGELRQAIAQGQLRLHYQPVVRLGDGALVGVEALVRWQHPTQGLVPPGDFIPLAEKTGAIAPLTDWVLAEALRQCHDWQAMGLPCGVAVNLSACTLHDAALPDTVQRLLAQYGVAPARLTLEVTESTLMARPEQARAVLTRLAEQGVRLAIDDFGTGHSSLSLLHHLPIHELKIDRSFVGAMATERQGASIVAFIAGLGHALGLHVVVEGVETEQTWAQLCALACDAAQGYAISRPLPATEVGAWLRRWRAA